MRRTMQINKVTRLAVLLHVVQILVFVGLFVATIFDLWHMQETARWALLFTSAVLVANNVQGIRDDLRLRDIARQEHMLRDAIAQLDKLNNTLRAHRHDFMNHLQVIYSLCEVNETKEAIDYIEKCYGALRKATRGVKTSRPAINALLQAKLGDAEQRGIHMEIDVRTTWQNAPITDWAMCRVLGNLIDNSFEALQGQENAQVRVSMYQDLRSFGFKVENNGPMVPERLRVRLFDQGISTKAGGQGQGLYIVRSLLREHGGDVTLVSTPVSTYFEGYMPVDTHHDDSLGRSKHE